MEVEPSNSPAVASVNQNGARQIGGQRLNQNEEKECKQKMRQVGGLDFSSEINAAIGRWAQQDEVGHRTWCLRFPDFGAPDALVCGKAHDLGLEVFLDRKVGVVHLEVTGTFEEVMTLLRNLRGAFPDHASKITVCASGRCGQAWACFPHCVDAYLPCDPAAARKAIVDKAKLLKTQMATVWATEARRAGPYPRSWRIVSFVKIAFVDREAATIFLDGTASWCSSGKGDLVRCRRCHDLGHISKDCAASDRMVIVTTKRIIFKTSLARAARAIAQGFRVWLGASVPGQITHPTDKFTILAPPGREGEVILELEKLQARLQVPFLRATDISKCHSCGNSGHTAKDCSVPIWCPTCTKVHVKSGPCRMCLQWQHQRSCRRRRCNFRPCKTKRQLRAALMIARSLKIWLKNAKEVLRLSEEDQEDQEVQREVQQPSRRASRSRSRSRPRRGSILVPRRVAPPPPNTTPPPRRTPSFTFEGPTTVRATTPRPARVLWADVTDEEEETDVMTGAKPVAQQNPTANLEDGEIEESISDEEMVDRLVRNRNVRA